MNQLPDKMEERRIRWLAALFLLFMLVMALIPAVRATIGIERGWLIDFHRDESFVRALFEGHYGEDPTYLGGTMWYPPLITWLESIVVLVTGLPIPTAIVKMGPYVNLLAPISFFLMAWYFMGPARAALTTAVFLFFTVGQEPAYAAASYSSRILPITFSQALFYPELILIDRAFRSGCMKRSVLAGLGAGFIFLAHPAPALIAVAMFAGFTFLGMIRAYRQGGIGPALKPLYNSLGAAGAFLAATLPFTWYLLGQTSLQTLNRAGFLFTYYALSLHNLPLFLHYNVSLFTLLGGIGLWILWRFSSRTGLDDRARSILLAWTGTSLFLFLYTYFVSMADLHWGIHLPGIVPTFHFFFYLKGAMVVLIGLVLWQFFAWSWSMVDRTTPMAMVRHRAKSVLVSFAITALACTLVYPSYATRRDLWVMYNRDMAFRDDRAGFQVAEALNRLLAWEDVVLCEVEAGAWPMLPTARHVLVTEATFGNPYMDQVERTRDNGRLLEGMRHSLPDTPALLTKYKVTHLLIRPSDLGQMPLAKQWFPRELYANPGYILLGR